MKLTENLSPAARTALINAGVSRRGALIPLTTPQGVVAELIHNYLVGINWGLTDRGVTARTGLVNAALDEAF